MTAGPGGAAAGNSVARQVRGGSWWAVLGAADALGEPLVALLGDPGYYHRFGFRLAGGRQIIPPEPSWHPYFQVRTRTSYAPSLSSEFAYPEPYRRLP